MPLPLPSTEDAIPVFEAYNHPVPTFLPNLITQLPKVDISTIGCTVVFLRNSVTSGREFVSIRTKTAIHAPLGQISYPPNGQITIEANQLISILHADESGFYASSIIQHCTNSAQSKIILSSSGHICTTSTAFDHLIGIDYLYLGDEKYFREGSSTALDHISSVDLEDQSTLDYLSRRPLGLAHPHFVLYAEEILGYHSPHPDNSSTSSAILRISNPSSPYTHLHQDHLTPNLTPSPLAPVGQLPNSASSSQFSPFIQAGAPLQLETHPPANQQQAKDWIYALLSEASYAHLMRYIVCNGAAPNAFSAIQSFKALNKALGILGYPDFTNSKGFLHFSRVERGLEVSGQRLITCLGWNTNTLANRVTLLTNIKNFFRKHGGSKPANIPIGEFKVYFGDFSYILFVILGSNLYNIWFTTHAVYEQLIEKDMFTSWDPVEPSNTGMTKLTLRDIETLVSRPRDTMSA